ncbi:MAG: sugar transferase [Kiritimatiellia bacterium]
MKRVFDLLLVLALAPLWVPLLGVAAALVRLNLGRPVLFAQERTGRGGRPFRLYKLRSMREGPGTDAERLTRFGRWLRATSLDELPELWHVLKGEMSLVGPRPLPVRYLPRYSPVQNRRHEVLPGITGWAQVNGRNALDWETKFRYDVDYVDSRSCWLDAKILLLTAVQVVARRGISHAGEATMGEFMGTDEVIAKPLFDGRGNV